MALIERLPGWQAGARWRNLFLLCLYVTLAGLVVLASPLVIAVLVWRDYRGTASKLSRLPGIDADGGSQSAAIGGLYGLIFLGTVVAGTATTGQLSSDTPGDERIGQPQSGGPTGSPPSGVRASPTDSLTSDSRAGPTTPDSSPARTTAAETPAAPGPVETPTRTTTETKGLDETPAQTTTVTTPSGSTATLTQTATPQPTSTPGSTRTPNPTPTDTEDLTVRVTSVVDGDTLEVRFTNESTDTVRLLGVDTPEIHVETDPAEFEGVPDTTAGRECLREHGYEASDFTKRLVAGETVTLTIDDSADSRGTYGRLLAYVAVGGTNVNYHLVARGYARVYDSRFTESERFYEAESTAQSEETGVWACRSVDPPNTRSFAIDTVHADAAGNDHDNLNDEYVTFVNRGEEPLDVGGWIVQDEAGHSYAVPDGTTLDPEARLTLHTGSGTDTESDLYWASGSAVWNNGGDTVIVFDDSGTKILEYSYD